jgi:O-antigen ligase
MRSPAWFLPYPLEWAWLILGLSSVSFVVRSSTQVLSGALDVTNLQRFGLVLIALTIIAPHLKQVPRFRLNPISLYLVYILFGVCSTLWSAGPLATFGKSIEMLAGVLVVWITMARVDAEARLRRLVYWTVIESMLGLVYVALGNIFDPTEFNSYVGRYEVSNGALLPYLWDSPKISADNVSVLGAVVGLFCLAEALARKKRRGLLFFILGYLASAVVAVLAGGRTGLTAFAAGTGLILFRHFPTSSVFMIPATGGIAVILLGNTLLNLFMRGQNPGMFYTLTGRTSIWEAGLAVFLTRPWLGSGWGVGARVVALAGFGPSGLTLLHNGFLEVLLGVGLVGFAIWVWALLWSWWLAATAYLRGDPLPFIVGMVAISLATVLLDGAGSWLDFLTQHFLAITGLLSLRQQKWVRATARRTSQLMVVGSHRKRGLGLAARDVDVSLRE